MKTHYLENGKPVCGVPQFRNSVDTKTGWYALRQINKCKLCQKQIADRSIHGHVPRYNTDYPEH